MGSSKKIEEPDFEYFRMYMAKKFSEIVSHKTVFNHYTDMDGVMKRYLQAVEEGLDSANSWFDNEVRDSQKPRFWTAHRSYSWCKRNPQRKRMLKVEIKRALLEATGEQNVNWAIVRLLPEGLVSEETIAELIEEDSRK